MSTNEAIKIVKKGCQRWHDDLSHINHQEGALCLSIQKTLVRMLKEFDKKQNEEINLFTDL